METIHLYNLSNLCRVCLSKTDVMSNIYDSSKGLCDLFRTIVNIEFEKNGTLPSYLCSICEEKILICKDFINQCKKTNDLLEKYKECNFKIEEEEDTKLCLESVPVTEVVEFIAQEDSNESTNYHKNIDQSVSKNTRKSRLKQFSYEEVMQAIEEEKKKCNNARNCLKCSFRARNFRSLSLHMTFVHKEMKENWCSTCNVVFDDLKQHSSVHENKENNCQFCGKSFSTRGHLLEHLMSHAMIRPYKCDICDKSFVNAKSLRVHNRIHAQEKPFICNFCGSSFTQLYPLKMHLERHHKNDRKFHCIHCKCIFEAEDKLKQHKCDDNTKESGQMLTDAFLGKQNYCNICEKNVRSLTIHNKNIHENAKSGDNNAMKLCTVCGKQFKSYSKLQVHMRIHTGETPYNCSYCDRKMATRNLLVSHERTHTGERPYVCHVCNKSFTQTSILNTHMKLHTGRPEMCMICEKKFCRPAELKLHMRKHTGEKPFVCVFCGKSFIQRSHLVEHARRHTDDKPFKCAHCDKSFRQRSSLKTHVQIHLGAKPFKCSQCPYACRQSYSLTIHMAKHINDAPRLDRPYSCDYCPKNFTTLAMLNSHLSNIHMTVSMQ